MTFVNAKVVGPNGRVHDSVRVHRKRVDQLGISAPRGDLVIDLEGAVVVAGLINAHDHLELNSFSRLKWRNRYVNVRDWIADFQPRFASDPALAFARAGTLADRLWVGGLKNLLSGVTTVSHHNPMHRPLRARFPVRVVRRFGMSHSLQIDGSRVAQDYRRTPAAWPWIIHAAEGIDSAANAEIDTLDRLGCLRSNTVVVHGVAIDAQQAGRMLAQGASLVWCPTSNEFLFGRTADVRLFSRAARLALGSDSRLSGSGDLLDEIRAAAATRQISAEALTRAVTSDAAAVLRLPQAGRLEPGAPADLAIIGGVSSDPFDTLVRATRGDLRLTMIDGVPVVADAGLAGIFRACREPYAEIRVDGRLRLLARWIARRASTLAVPEPGLEVAA